jgi:hypothetical protein
MKIGMRKIHLPLKVNWKLSRNETLFKENFIIEIEDAGKIFRGEVAPNIRYGETPDLVQTQFYEFVKNVDISRDLLWGELDSFDLCASLRFGIQAAVVSREAYREKKSLPIYMGLSDLGHLGVPTSFSVPIMEISEVAAYVESL